MDASIRITWDDLHAADGAVRSAALSTLLAVTEQPVDWAYEVWDTLVAALSHADNHQRAIAAQLLCNLAKSDPEQRMLRDFERLVALTHDPRFVTARHSLQALWKVGAVSPAHQELVLARLAARFQAAATEKNGTLIRSDLVAGLGQLYVQTRSEQVRETALALIATETDETYRKKYARVWRTSGIAAP